MILSPIPGGCATAATPQNTTNTAPETRGRAPIPVRIIFFASKKDTPQMRRQSQTSLLVQDLICGDGAGDKSKKSSYSHTTTPQQNITNDTSEVCGRSPVRVLIPASSFQMDVATAAQQSQTSPLLKNEDSNSERNNGLLDHYSCETRDDDARRNNNWVDEKVFQDKGYNQENVKRSFLLIFPDGTHVMPTHIADLIAYISRDELELFAHIEENHAAHKIIEEDLKDARLQIHIKDIKTRELREKDKYCLKQTQKMYHQRRVAQGKLFRGSKYDVGITTQVSTFYEEAMNDNSIYSYKRRNDYCDGTDFNFDGGGKSHANPSKRRRTNSLLKTEQSKIHPITEAQLYRVTKAKPTKKNTNSDKNATRMKRSKNAVPLPIPR